MKNKVIVAIAIAVSSVATMLIINQQRKISGLEKEMMGLMAADPNRIPRTLSENILQPPQEWCIIYGDEMESRLTYNIAIIINTLNQQARIILELKDRVFDPNGTKI